MDKRNETKRQTGIWKGWTTAAFIGTDEFGDPIYARRRFYRCSICRQGTVIKSNYCTNCGAKMGSE